MPLQTTTIATLSTAFASWPNIADSELKAAVERMLVGDSVDIGWGVKLTLDQHSPFMTQVDRGAGWPKR